MEQKQQCQTQHVQEWDVRCGIVFAVHRQHSVHEAKRAYDGGRDQHFGVEPQPAEVEADLVPEVSAHQVEGLSFEHFPKICPLQIKQLPPSSR